MPKKVLRIINRFNLGGPVNNALYLTKYMEDYETRLIGGRHTEEEVSAEFMFQDLDVPYEVIPEMSRKISLFDDFKAFFKICKIVKTYRPDIIHTHASKAGMFGRLAGFLYRTPVVVHTFHGHVFHSYFGKFKTLIFLNIERFLARLTTKIVAISPIQKKELSEQFRIASPEKFRVIPLGFDLKGMQAYSDANRLNFRIKYQLDAEELAIGIVGRLVPIKDHHLFIKAIALLKEKTTRSFRAFIIGDGDMKQDLVDYACSLGLSVSFDNQKADIHFTSWISKTSEVYPGLDIVALSSKNEGTPVALIEAQVAGKPIVSTNVGGTKDILVDSEFNLLSSNDAEDFSEQLKTLISTLESHPYDTNISKQTIENFHYSNLVEKMGDLYEELLKTS